MITAQSPEPLRQGILNGVIEAVGIKLKRYYLSGLAPFLRIRPGSGFGRNVLRYFF
jgi:hypothetical protein